MMLGCGSMRVIVGWFKGNYDAYLEAYEVDDEALLRGVHEYQNPKTSFDASAG
jgi:hypothetical protein